MGLLTAAEMQRESRLIYESIVSANAPGYTSREWSELLTIAQLTIVDNAIEEGIDRNEINRRIVSKLVTHFSQTIVSAYLTGGTGAKSTPATWATLTNGSFRISIDGTAYNIDAIDFTGDTTMVNVSDTIQVAIRTATAGTETVVWSTDHFIISSTLITPSSDITVTSTSTGTVGTDISGATGLDWIDSDSGNGVITNATIKTHSNYDDTFEVKVPSDYYHTLSRYGRLTSSTQDGLKLVPYSYDAYKSNVNNPFKKPYIDDNNSDGELWELISGDDTVTIFSASGLCLHRQRHGHSRQ